METKDFKNFEKTKKFKDEKLNSETNKNLTNEEIFENLRKENKKDELIFGAAAQSNSTPELVKKLKEPHISNKQIEEKTNDKKVDLVSSLRDIVNRNKKLKEEEEKKKMDEEIKKNTINDKKEINDVLHNCKIELPIFLNKQTNVVNNSPLNTYYNESSNKIEIKDDREEIKIEDLIPKLIDSNSDSKNSNKYWKNLTPIIFKGNKFTDESFIPNTHISFFNMDIHTPIIKEKSLIPSLFNNKLGGIINATSENFDNSRVRSRLIQQIKPENIRFERSSEKLINSKILEEGFENIEYKRSLYEQCLLCIFTCLSFSPEKISDLIRIKKENEFCYYEIFLYIDDCWQIIFVDDFFPFSIKENNFLSYTNEKNLIWPMLIEKAFAKYCGGYYEMYYTDCSKYLRVLTGNESGLVKIVKPEIFEFIRENLQIKSILISNTRDFEKIQNRNESELMFLKANCYYVILDAFDIQWPPNSEVTKLLKIGSVLEEIERDGKFSKSSNYFPDDIKRILFDDKYYKEKFGYIYITIDEFIRNFDSVYFSKTNDENTEPHLIIDQKLKELNFIKNEEINSPLFSSNPISPKQNEEIFDTENIKNIIYKDYNQSNSGNTFSLKIKEYWNGQNYKDEMNKKFIDDNFYPNKNNLYSLDKIFDDLIYENGRNEYKRVINDKKYENLSWERISELDEFKNIENLCVIEDITPSTKWVDIYEQSETDSYFMSIIISIIKKPFLVEKLIRTKMLNKFCFYEVILFIDNSWKIVVIDDYILYDMNKKKTFGVKAYKNQIWPLLLFKAYIKICGGYLNMSICNPSSCFTALTGFEAGYYDTDKIDIFQFTYDSLKNGYFLLAKSKNNFEEKGAKNGFYYIIVNCFETTKEGFTTKLLKLRAPWTNFRWEGQWDLKSPIWEEESKQIMLKKSLFSLNGFFIVNYDEFVKYFENIIFSEKIILFYI